MRIRSILLAAATAVASLCAQAAALTDAQVERLMKAARVPESLKLVSDGMQTSFQQMLAANTQLSEAQRAAAGVQFGHAFSAERLQQDVCGAIRNSVSDTELKALLRWYESPLGRRVTALDQQQAPDEDAGLALKSGMDALIQAGPVRGQLYKRYIATTRQDEIVADFLLHTMKIVSAASERLRPGTGKPADAIDAAFAQARPSLVAQVSAGTLARIAVRYRGLTDSQLKSVIAFEASAPEQHLVQAYLEGMKASVQSGTQRLTSALAYAAGPAEDEDEDHEDDEDDGDDEDEDSPVIDAASVPRDA